MREYDHFVSVYLSLLLSLVLAQLVCGEDGILLKVNLLRMIADCDIHPTSEDLDTLFNQVRDNEGHHSSVICQRHGSKVHVRPQRLVNI